MKDHELLGVKEGTSVEDIKKAYRVKMMRYQQLGEDKTAEDEAKFNEITDAYNRLCDYKTDDPYEPDSKIRNFWDYNKEKILVILFVVIIISVFVVQLAGRVSYDLNIALIGNYGYSDDNGNDIYDIRTAINEIVKEKVLDVNEPYTDYYRRSGDLRQDSDYAARQTALVMRVEFGEIDLTILDKENYYDFYDKGFLYELDDFINIQKGEVSIPENLLVRNLDDEAEEGPIYGIRLAGNDLIEDLGLVYKNDLIVCIFKNSAKKEVAFAALMAFID